MGSGNLRNSASDCFVAVVKEEEVAPAISPTINHFPDTGLVIESIPLRGADNVAFGTGDNGIVESPLYGVLGWGPSFEELGFVTILPSSILCHYNQVIIPSNDFIEVSESCLLAISGCFSCSEFYSTEVLTAGPYFCSGSSTSNDAANGSLGTSIGDLRFSPVLHVVMFLEKGEWCDLAEMFFLLLLVSRVMVIILSSCLLSLCSQVRASSPGTLLAISYLVAPIPSWSFFSMPVALKCHSLQEFESVVVSLQSLLRIVLPMVNVASHFGTGDNGVAEFIFGVLPSRHLDSPRFSRRACFATAIKG